VVTNKFIMITQGGFIFTFVLSLIDPIQIESLCPASSHR
jgi:hypothetical protein